MDTLETRQGKAIVFVWRISYIKQFNEIYTGNKNKTRKIVRKMG